MKRRRGLWLLAVPVVLAAVAMLLPGSPVSLLVLTGRDGRFEDGHTLPFWIKALDDPQASIRHRAAHAIGAIGPEAGEAVPALAAMMVEDPSTGARIEASLALTKMAPGSREAIPALAQALADKERWVRLNAALALMRLGKEACPAVPALLRAFADKRNETNLGAFHVTIREVVAVVLGRASAGSAAAVPALTAALTADAPRSTRLAVARALGEIGAEARPAVPRLRALLDRDDGEMRRTVEEALQKIQEQRAAR